VISLFSLVKYRSKNLHSRLHAVVVPGVEAGEACPEMYVFVSTQELPDLLLDHDR
jgi:hypothetical protein